MKKKRVVVINSPLRYRIKGVNKDKAFVPKIGKIISLPIEIVEKEIKSGHVRELFPEEIKSLEEKKKKKASGTKKKVSSKKGKKE